MTRRLFTAVLAAVVALAGTPVAAQSAQEGPSGQPTAYDPTATVADPELAKMTGKFILPNGAELALSIVSDAVVNGQAVLRTVLTIDGSADLKVFARPVGAQAGPEVTSVTVAGSPQAAAAQAPGVSVVFDRQSGARLVTPMGGGGTPGLSVGASGTAPSADPAAEAAARGLSQVTPVAGGPALATADGTVTLTQLANGSAVALSGDRYGVLQLVGRSVATAAVNTANDRVIDTVTNVGVTLRDVTPYTTGSAMMRADTLALDATARMIR